MKAILRTPLFSHGFRPFFLAAGVHALVAVPAWLWLRRAGTSPLPTLPAQLWHGHEMVFGFVIAAVTGFLLTAVPSWTGRRGFAGLPLLLLTATWLAGRAAIVALIAQHARDELADITFVVDYQDVERHEPSVMFIQLPPNRAVRPTDRVQNSGLRGCPRPPRARRPSRRRAPRRSC